MSGDRGFTLLELILVVLIVGILSAIGVPVYNKFLNKARSVQAVAEISTLEKEIMMYKYEDPNQRLPTTLTQLSKKDITDPWGRPYQYAQTAALGTPRQDRFSVNLNSDYDLYSLGEDGQSAPSLTAAASQDDIVRANDGGYIGLASEY